DAAYLDIETNGLGQWAKTTVVSVHNRGRTTTLVRGIDLTPENLAKAFEGAKMLVTFNGSSFDVPMLNKEFPFIVPRIPHFDLRHGAHRVGYSGGLKLLEQTFGIKRPQEVAFVTGEEAVYLWKLWEKHKKENALKLLMKYNQEDTVNLELIAGKVHDKLIEWTWKV
ncbi:MAG: ribonuclease H-like domain-containing protein, partial [Methanomassiliicoccales archaeon]